MRILFLAANPSELTALDLAEEVRDVKRELDAVAYRDSVEYNDEHAVRPDDLVRFVRLYKPNVIHFSGHGSSPGIYLHQESGSARLVTGESLRQFLDGRGVRLVVLNACHSKDQADALTGVVPAVVGTTDAVGDEAARRFSSAFYRSLGNGLSVGDAFRDGSDAVALNDLTDVFHCSGNLALVLAGPSKSKWYSRIRAAIVLLTIAMAAVGGYRLLRPPPKVHQNVEIVLDRSASMDGSFDGGTRWQAAKAAIDTVLAEHGGTRTNLALRGFGGPCVGDNSQLRVGFRTNNVRSVQDALDGLSPNGEATLVAAIREAIQDFAEKRFDGVSKRIIVIVGQKDSCVKDPIAAIETQLTEAIQRGDTIRADFRYIGLALPGDQATMLDAIATATGGHFVNVGNRKELEEVFKRFAVLEPVIGDVNTMTTIINAVIEDVNATIGHVNTAAFADADSTLGEARARLKDTDLPFEDLAGRKGNPKVEALFQLAAKNRELQVEALRMLGGMIRQARNGEDWSAASAEWGRSIDAYNTNAGEMNRIIGTALAQAVTHRASATTAATKEMGSLVVSGTGAEQYVVLDSAAKGWLTSHRLTNSSVELLPGTYIVELNGTRQRVVVAAGKQAVVAAGSLVVSGTGQNRYVVFDSTGQHQLVASRGTNEAVEVLPGTYKIKVGDRMLTAVVRASERTTISP